MKRREVITLLGWRCRLAARGTREFLKH